MKNIIIWIVWLALVLVWLTPDLNHVRDQLNEHNEQIKRSLNE